MALQTTELQISQFFPLKKMNRKFSIKKDCFLPVLSAFNMGVITSIADKCLMGDAAGEALSWKTAGCHQEEEHDIAHESWPGMSRLLLR